MNIYVHRVETTLTDDQYELLMRLAEQSGRSPEELVRDAFVQAYAADPHWAKRLAALKRLLSLELPTGIWESS
ncbi:MAG: CopG family transcriptional regulator [Anaerolineae bacterium]|nr:ribbon-helix-helix domain-containing protein [Anaerolineae bacterium]MDW8098244.1 CopG family transcriptional regulator [Anaerolineae bacterium]